MEVCEKDYSKYHLCFYSLRCLIPVKSSCLLKPGLIILLSTFRGSFIFGGRGVVFFLNLPFIKEAYKYKILSLAKPGHS